jgi:tetratricopeptide (TPR) repeat protein
MVTLRTYSNPAEAAIAKSVLDDHNIVCSLADENVNLYGGGPLAMPIRLLVKGEQAEEATRILETKGPELPEDSDVNAAPNEPADMNEQILAEVRGLYHSNQLILLVAIIVLVISVFLAYQIPRHISPWSPVYQAMRQYDYARAAELTQRLVQQHPDDYYGHEYLGDIYLKLGNLNQAEQEYSRASQLVPPEHLKAKLEQVRNQIEHQSRPRLNATSSPWPK